MEQGFWHPEIGYWQAIAAPTEASVAAYPAGTVSVPIRPGPGYVWGGEAWVYSSSADPVPAEVTRFQALAAMHNAGLLAAVETAVAVADPFTQIAWNNATGFLRASPTIAALQAAVGLSEAQVDDLFRAAAQITA